MNETTRTLSYLGAAVVSVVLAIFMAPSIPRAPDEFSEVGKQFYKDFAATDATSLTVVSFNEDTRAKVFNVEQKNGKWVIGSHRDYPADGKDRLAKTAASVIGIKKEQFATKDPEQYADLQVIDPLDEDGQKLKGRGQRITLKNSGGEVLADYIIGKRVPNRDNYYYVRSPNEKSVYMAKLNIDLSTKFADWIESDLLKLQGENLNEIVVNKYSIDKEKGRLVGQETNILKRPKPADPWTLEGLDEAKEEVNQDEVRTMTTALSDLKILGVREKPQGLSADLKADKGITLDQLTMMNLRSRGFFVTPDGQLLSNEGEMVPITDGGVAYTLRFGEVFIGSELEMETGLEAEKRKQDEKDNKSEKADEKTGNKSRYVFITAHFDPAALGPKPEPPAATPAPAANTPPAGDAQPAEEKPAEAQPAEEKPVEEKPAEAAPETKADADPCQAEPPATETPAAPAAPAAAPVAPAGQPADAPKGPTPEEAAKAAALEAQKKYEQDLKAYEEKVAKGQAKVKELNERFADWYYVISEENFMKLRLSRASLVKPKTMPETKPGEGAAPGAPAIPGAPTTPATTPDQTPPATPETPAAPETKPEEAAPAETKPESKPETTDPAAPATEPKAEEPQPEQPKAEEPAPAESKPESTPEAAPPEAPQPTEPKPE